MPSVHNSYLFSLSAPWAVSWYWLADNHIKGAVVVLLEAHHHGLELAGLKLGLDALDDGGNQVVS